MTFSKREALALGWQRFRERPLFLVGLFLITTLISAVTGAIAEQMDTGVVGLGVNLADFALQILISMGMTLVLIRVYDEVATDYGDILEPIHLFWKYLVMTILVLIVVIVGLFLFVIPGIIAGIALSMAPYLVIDRNLGPVEAMKESIRITNGHKWNLFVFGIIIVALNVCGALLLGVGLFVTIPVSALAAIHAYRWVVNPPSDGDVAVSALAKVLSVVGALAVVLAIAGAVVLSGVAIQSTPSERDDARKDALVEIRLAAALYKDVHDRYPEELSVLAPDFIASLPTDPLTRGQYNYALFEGGFDYEICTMLEADDTLYDGVYCEFGSTQ